MTVQDAARSVTVPQQAGPADPPLAEDETVPAAAPAPLLGRDRALTTDERQFALGLVAMALVLGTYIVVFLLVSAYAWD